MIMQTSPESKFTGTPGPWKAKAQAVGGYIIAREGVTVVGHSIAGVRQSKAANEAQCEANAHLIAAAPDMYEALKQAEQWLLGWASAEQQLAVIRAALSKADGLQSTCRTE